MSLNLTRICILSQRLLKSQYLCHVVASKKLMSYLGNWKPPEGHDTGVKIFNSAVNKKVPLILKKEDFVTWYMCGPTVYAESHIGHASCYVNFDIIRRILENVFNIKVFLLLGITDIDDKIIQKANEAEVPASHIAKQFELDFFQDWKSLKMLYPTVVSRVSENIPQIISFCEKLIEKDFAYVTSEGNVYFMVSKSVTADLQSDSSENLVSDTRIDPLKKDPRDFALWKASKPNEPFWESPWGNGRPGWHIECSAIASKIFGSEVDLHSGGSDLLFPHHANEKSQSEAYHGCSQWVNYWLHAGLLQLDDELKMSKSIGNTISIKDFLKDNDVNDFRILCLQTAYRKNLHYNLETLSGAKSLHKKIHSFINECESYIVGELSGSIADINLLMSKLSNIEKQITGHLKDDFNTSQALLCLTDFIDDINKSLQLSNSSKSLNPSEVVCLGSCYFYVNKVLETFGIDIITKKKLPSELPFAVDAVVKFRNKLRLLALDPKSIVTHQIATAYVNNAYSEMKKELDILYNSQPLPKLQLFTSLELLEESKNFYSKAYKFAEMLNGDKNLDMHELKPKEVKKIMAPLFIFCDEFRSALIEKGIGIKDRGKHSSWIPLIGLVKYVKETAV